MVESNLIFIGWNKAEVGRESKAHEHFGEFIGWCTELQSKGNIESFEPCILQAHGGDMNGFVVLRGQPAKLDDLVKSEQWIQHVMRGNLNLSGFGAVRGYAGNTLQTMMKAFGQLASTY